MKSIDRSKKSERCQERNDAGISDHVIPVNIQSQLNRIETELTLLSRKNKRKRIKRISIQQRESKNQSPVGNGTGIKSDDDEDREDEDRGDDDRGDGDRGDEDRENEDCEESVEETDSEIEEPAVKKKRSESVGDKKESVGEMLTSFSTNNDETKDEGNETLDNLMSLFSEEPA